FRFIARRFASARRMAQGRPRLRPADGLAGPGIFPHDPTGMRQWAEFTLEDDESGGAATLTLIGPLRVSSIGDLDAQLDQVSQEIARVDLAGVTEIDTSGAWLAWRFAEEHKAAIVGESEQAGRLIKAISKVSAGDVDRPPEPGLLKRTAGEVGAKVIAGGEG